jgi:hypothetical protein
MSSPPDEYPNDQRNYPNPESSPLELADTARLRARAWADLGSGNWAAAEQGFTGLLTRGGAGAARDALAIVGVAQARLFGRLDTRGAFAMLQSLLHSPQLLDDESAIRLDITAAFLFSTVDAALCDPERARRHATDAARRLSTSQDRELGALAASAELLAMSLLGDAAAFLRGVEQRRRLLDAAREPVTRCLHLEILALAALARGGDVEEREAFRLALEAASALGFAACEARLQACAALRSLDLGRRAFVAVSGPRRSTTPPGMIVVSSLVFPTETQAELRRLAPSRVTVLLEGGSVSSRMDAARALHELSARVSAPFVAFDCAAQDSDAIELHLFGGPAYLGSAGGAIRLAETGTLYVSTIDELPLLMQPRFLRFLDQEKRVRVVASANDDLEAHVQRGLFRADLGDRLTLVKLVLPNRQKSV